MEDEIYMKTGFIGTGNMASAMIRGVLSSGIVQPDSIWVYDIDKKKIEKLQEQFGVVIAKSSIEVVKECKFIIPSVKPQYIENVLTQIKDYLTEEHLIISIAAGVSRNYIESVIDSRCQVVRTMPNTPALSGEGMTAVCLNKSVREEDMVLVKELLQSFGKIELIDEAHIHAATAVSGSSPAYAFMFIEALADGAVLMGMPRDQSYRMAAQALLGAAKMVLETGQHPGILKDNVCSPGGTTIEAVAALEEGSFRSSVINAVRSCAEKSAAMGRERD